jgi:predicted TPR repeat methyltransferase
MQKFALICFFIFTQLFLYGLKLTPSISDPCIISICTVQSPVVVMAGEKRDFDAEAATWDENPFRVKLAHDVARAIIGTVNPGPDTDVLDFGSGTGLLTLALQPHVRSVTAVDTSQGMLDVLDAKVRAQKLPNVRTRLVDLERGDALEGKYDLVVSTMTFHHIRDVGVLLDRLSGVLTSVGWLAVADLDSDEGKFHDTPEGVFHNGFDRSVMMKYFEHAGFESVRNRTAAMMAKPSPSGEMRTFTIFLMTGKKRA